MKAIFNHLLQRTFALLLKRLELLSRQQCLIKEWALYPERQLQYEQKMSDLIEILRDNQEDVCDMLMVASCVKPEDMTPEQEEIGKILEQILQKSISDYKKVMELASEMGMTYEMQEEIDSTLHIGVPNNK